MPRETANSPRIWPALLFVLLVAAVGGWVRWLIASSEILWLDELHTSWSVAGSLGEVYQRALSGNQTPLYFWISWLSVEVFGETEFSLRLVSLIAGTGTIIAAAWLVLRWTGSTIAAVVTSLLIALDVQFIYYATEARPYALVQFLGVVQVALFWRLINWYGPQIESVEAESETAGSPELTGNSSQWVWLSLVTALLFYTHVTSAWLFAGEAIFVCIALLIGKSLKRLLLASVVAAALCVPAFLQLGQLAARRSNWSSVSSTPELLLQQALPAGIWLLVPAAAILIAILSGKERGSPAVQKRLGNCQLGFVALWALMPTVLVVAFDLLEVAPMALARYTLVGAAAMPIFAGLAIGFIDVRKIRLFLAIALIAVSLIWSPITSGKFVTSGFDAGELPGLRWEDWKSPVDQINANQAKRNHPVLLASNLIEDVDALENSAAEFQAYVRFPVKGIYQIDTQTPSGTENETSSRQVIAIPTLPGEHTRASDIETIKNSGGAWLIVRGTPELALEIEDEIVNEMAAQFPEAGQLKTVGFANPHSHVYLISFDW